jgi:hypothetical protein
MHREGNMQFQSPVALRLLPTLPSKQQLKGPLPSGSQTDRGGGAPAAALKSTGSKTHRTMASTNATSLAAVKQASQRNQSLFVKIGESVNNFSAALRADAQRNAGAAEAAEAAQALSDVVNGIIRPSQPPAVTAAGNSKNSDAVHSAGTKDPAPALGKRGPLSKQLATSLSKASSATDDPPAADGPSSRPLITQIERLMAACSSASKEESALEPASARRRGEKAVKTAGKCANKRSSSPVVVRIRHLPLGYVLACARVAFI